MEPVRIETEDEWRERPRMDDYGNEIGSAHEDYMREIDRFQGARTNTEEVR
ncbi:MAG: hypothetical protein R2710_21785 [Acidimicrobiales bacterium]